MMTNAPAAVEAPKRRGYPIPTDPTVYYTKPLETWTVRELTDALGFDTAAGVLDITVNHLRMLRMRGSTRIERLQALQAAVAADEDKCRKALVTRYTYALARKAAQTTKE